MTPIFSDFLKMDKERYSIQPTNYKRFVETGYAETFESLHVEVDLLSDTYKTVHDQFDGYKVFSLSNQRNKRSLLPVVGQQMSSLFGTFFENNLENINRNI